MVAKNARPKVPPAILDVGSPDTSIVIAGVVVGFVTDPLKPFAETTETVLTEPEPDPADILTVKFPPVADVETEGPAKLIFVIPPDVPTFTPWS